MQIDIFEFDIANNQILNTESQSCLRLTRTESQVLEQLSRHPNQIMTKGQLACAGSHSAVMSESAVSKAVFTLRKYFGEDHAELIETIPRKGYRLNIAPPKASWIQRSNKYRKHALYSVLMMLLVTTISVAAMHKYILFKPAETPIKNSRTVTLINNQDIELTWLESPTITMQQDIPVEQRIIAALNQCHYLPWSQVFLAYSNDMQVFNISMAGRKQNGDSLMRNIKTSDFSLSPNFISEKWLDEVSLCD
ncbi:winged helix-turn-helix domain-containing protein [Shewanella donghaensis]|uniref:winged helix-turn-helix domain-containing protein n=1 Tax=Shewanella donghaensis TaxID=238836 RepID=UPI0011825023|nr:winged helix-turn-helix domain-containing protein [Shewanella donghaensis]